MRFKSVAAVFRDYFQHGESTSADPDAVGELPLRHVVIDGVRVIGKETHAAWADLADDTDMELGASKAIDAADYGADSGATDYQKLLSPYRTADLMLATGLPRDTLKSLSSGRTGTPADETRSALHRGLWLLSPDNPDHILNWRDVPTPWLMETIGWDETHIQQVRSGKLRLEEKERAAYIAAVRRYEEEHADNDYCPSPAELETRASLLRLWGG